MHEAVISIVNYNQCELLNRCLANLKSLNLPESWCTIVVDNNSSDGSVDMVSAQHPWVKLIKSRKNLGYGGGHNVAYSQTESPYFFVLNPDVLILPGSIQHLRGTLDQFAKAAIAGPCLLNPDGSIQYSARRFYNWRTVLCRRLPLPGQKKLNSYHLMKDLNVNRPYNVDWIVGAALAIRRTAFPGNTLFDPRYKLYFEDVDLCYSAHEQGWDVLYDPNSKMIHDHQRASANALSWAVCAHFVSWLKFYFKVNRRYKHEFT